MSDVSKDERYVVCINSVGGKTWVGIDYEKTRADGKFETIGSLRASVDEETRRATIHRNKSTTREQNYEGYYKCGRYFNKISLELKVSEVYDEREHIKELGNSQKAKATNAQASKEERNL